MPVRQVVLAGKAGSRVAGIQRAIAIAILRINLGRAGGTTFGVGLADHDRLALESGTTR